MFGGKITPIFYFLLPAKYQINDTRAKAITIKRLYGQTVVASQKIFMETTCRKQGPSLTFRF